ncbi:sporulation integral membrane protein YlbJ [Proteiniborus sp. MB09-C3]|uniref:sporulation integral membrane protein YlbJ n=1 Tax=Proteiniborus sp. MB09-C3 TaxID=3050072 RepID=UPI00255537FE|nr:sporulation integral membrane protein YlbJ [Proteiniborus sp. MB09-C3]WIV10818.1 sporulation integral membrane protein YlbJ [Proteiniborus sp. MB09-C3]
MANYLVILFSISIVFFAIHKIYKKIINRFENIKTYLLILIVVFLVSCLIIYPNNTISAAFNGLVTWSSVVLPSLLPFFIGAEILIGLGVVNFIGTLLNPVMYPLFGTSGEGSFAFAMSITSGYPVGVSLVSRLRKQNIISRVEAQRLVSFCSTSGPLFMIGAVSIGMFKNSSIGTLLASSHYLGAITVGLLFRGYGKAKIKNKNNKIYSNSSNNYLKNALSELIAARKKDGRSMSILMSDSIKSALEAMFMVGGFIVIYSVIIEILLTTGVINLLASFFKLIIPINLDIKLIEGLISGLLEMTNGCKLISTAKNASIISQLCSVSFLIGWSGLSIHSQAISMLNNTDISPKLYILSKVFHAMFSSIYCFVLYKIFFKNIVVMSFLSENYSIQENLFENWLKTLRFSIGLEFIILMAIIVLSIFIGTIYSIRSLSNK